MAWVSQSYLENMIGTDAVTALGLSTAGILAQYEGAARARVISVMQQAGYSSPGSTVDTSTDSGAFLAHLCASVLVRDAYQLRKGVSLREAAQSAISEGIGMLDALYNKQLPIPGMEPDTLAGIGGNVGSPSIGTNARPAYFTGGKLAGFG